MYQKLHAETDWHRQKKKLLHLQYKPTLNFWNPHTTQRCTVKATRKACLNRKWPCELYDCFLMGSTLPSKVSQSPVLPVCDGAAKTNPPGAILDKVVHPDQVIDLFLLSLIHPAVKILFCWYTVSSLSLWTILDFSQYSMISMVNKIAVKTC